MPVIAAGIINKNGKILVSRHYTEVARVRIEGLLTAFPKLLGTGASKQCTFVETAAVRYVYQPLEGLYLLLVTSKNSNIVEDLTTLRLMGRLVPEYVTQGIDEQKVTEKAFEILFAFDEVITCGYRENVTLEQVMSIVEMHSHEEELANEEKERVIREAKKVATQRARELARKRKEQGALGGDSFGGGGGGNAVADAAPAASGAGSGKTAFNDQADDLSEAKKPTAAASTGGMALGRARKADLASKAMAEAGIASAAPSSAVPGGAATAGAAGGSASPRALDRREFHIKIEEKVSATLNRDGGVSSLDIRGDLFVNVTDPAVAAARIQLSGYNDEFQFKTHPNINKNLFTSDRVLVSKDNKPFPVQQALGILRWRLQTAGKVKLPISVNCWPGDDELSVEFELENTKMTLRNVRISIPLGGAFPSVEEIETGSTYSYDDSSKVLHWIVPLIDKHSSSGTMAVKLNREVAASTFFPTVVVFASEQCAADVAVADVSSAETGRPVPFSVEAIVTSDEYVVA